VEIEARLLSANKAFSRELGSQLGFVLGNNSQNSVSGVGAVGASPFVRTPSPSVNVGDAIPLSVNLPAAGTSGLSFLMGAGSDIILDAIITAAEARGTAKLISRPKVMTQNNTAAVVSQGTQIPVQSNQNNTVSVQFLNFSLKLTVTPQITDVGTILMQVNIENSAPDFAKAVNGIPSVATQQAVTSVLVPDGGTAVIGGILVDTDSYNLRQVPGLGSVPLIGNLFKNTQVIKKTDELLFFITPRIKPADSVTVTPPGEQR
jgi:type IV pilus assembly protein PilQ